MADSKNAGSLHNVAAGFSLRDGAMSQTRGQKPAATTARATATPARRAPRDRGQAVVEYAIIIPLQMLLTLGLVQIGHLFIVQHVVNYAAFCAARAEVVGRDANEAAALAMLKVTGKSGVPAGSIYIPGWGQVEGMNAARQKTRVTVLPPDASGPQPPPVRVEVRHDCELIFPVVNQLAYALGHALFALENVDRSYGDWPHIPLTGTCTYPRPWPQTAGGAP